MSKIRVRQVRSVISQPRSVRRVVEALGLRRIGQENTVPDNNCARGMVNKVSHLVSYELIND